MLLQAPSSYPAGSHTWRFLSRAAQMLTTRYRGFTWSTATERIESQLICNALHVISLIFLIWVSMAIGTVIAGMLVALLLSLPPRSLRVKGFTASIASFTRRGQDGCGKSRYRISRFRLVMQTLLHLRCWQVLAGGELWRIAFVHGARTQYEESMARRRELIASLPESFGRHCAHIQTIM